MILNFVSILIAFSLWKMGQGIDVPVGSCKKLKDLFPGTPSGVHHIPASPYSIVEVYCEMGLNGGGYTFLSPKTLTEITDADLQSLFTDRQSLLMRIRKCDGTQPYTILEQLPQYRNEPIHFGLTNFTGYQVTINNPLLGPPYIYAGFLPRRVAAATTVQGISANGVSQTFQNCDANGNSYIALFPNFEERAPSEYLKGYDFPFCNNVFNGARVNPSTRVMPPEYFMFGEFHFGGCGCYTQADERLRNKCILGFAVGFR